MGVKCAIAQNCTSVCGGGHFSTFQQNVLASRQALHDLPLLSYQNVLAFSPSALTAYVFYIGIDVFDDLLS